MSEQASLHLINLASVHGLAKAREILGMPAPGAEPVAPVANEETRPDSSQTGTQDAGSQLPPVTDAAAQRAAEDAGAQNATVAQLKTALDQLGIAYAKNAGKAKLLAAFLARP